jgi:hypothetical protein
MRRFRPTVLAVLAGLAMSAGALTLPTAPPPAAGEELPPAHDAAGKVVNSYAVVDGEMVDVPQIKMGEQATIARIFKEGADNSQVMDILAHLTQEIGPRLTGSSNAEAANRWAMEQFASWGLANPHLDEWGTIAMRFDRGPSAGRAFMGDGENASYQLKAITTLAWVPGTDGPVRGKAVRMPADEAELEAIKEKLPGAWVIVPTDFSGRSGIRGVTGSVSARYRARQEVRDNVGKPPPAPVVIPDDPMAGPWEGTLQFGRGGGYGVRLSVDKNNDGTVGGTMAYGEGSPSPIENGAIDGDKLTFEFETSRGRSRYELTAVDGGLKGTSTRVDDPERTFELTFSRPPTEPEGPSMLERVMEYKPAGYVSSSKDQRVWTSSVAGWRELTPDQLARDVEVIISEPDYDYLNSKIVDGADLELEFDMQNTLTEGPIPVYNTVAEIRGTERPDEVVIVSAHLDSWNGPGSQGATDNGTGSSVTLEAARILAAAGAKPKRTIRFILWTGEEQGLLGSRSYVERLSEEEKAKVVCCLVDDGGTNYQGGIQGIESQRDYLAAATAPINGRIWDSIDGGYLNVNVQISEGMPQGGGSDHASFNAIGIPGYFWDETGRAEYGYGWHTQHDKLELAIPNYLRQSATNTAIVAYNLACAPEMLPREVKEEETASESN